MTSKIVLPPSTRAGKLWKSGADGFGFGYSFARSDAWALPGPTSMTAHPRPLVFGSAPLLRSRSSPAGALPPSSSWLRPFLRRKPLPPSSALLSKPKPALRRLRFGASHRAASFALPPRARAFAWLRPLVPQVRPRQPRHLCSPLSSRQPRWPRIRSAALWDRLRPARLDFQRMRSGEAPRSVAVRSRRLPP